MMNTELFSRAVQVFQNYSPGSFVDVRVFFAPGRVNMIGEHLDYNGGFVFPAALTQGIFLFVRPRQDRIVRFCSLNFDHVVEASLDHLLYVREDDYANYPKGVLWVFQEQGFSLTGADFLFAGDLPSQAGLSSSAAIEVVMAYALNALHGHALPLERLVLLAERAENLFVGVNCGVMDQFAVGLGKAHHALLLHTSTLSFEQVPFLFDHVRIVIANTNKRRELADSKYNERREQCGKVLVAAQQMYPTLRFLTDMTEEMWTEFCPRIEDPILVKRGRHVIHEHARVVTAAKALRQQELARFGELMNDSHRSLRDDYEVTGKELDALAMSAWRATGCIGSRMTGAGFGGCTVSLVKAAAVTSFEAEVRDTYVREIGIEPSFYVSDFGDGVHEMTEEVRELWPF